MKKSKKIPLLAALLNFAFLGAGYLYLGKRKLFGWLMIAVFVAMSIEYLLGTVDHINNLADGHTISMFIIALAVAVDGYKTGMH